MLLATPLVPLGNEVLVAIVGVDYVDLDLGRVFDAIAGVVLEEVDLLRTV